MAGTNENTNGESSVQLQAVYLIDLVPLRIMHQFCCQLQNEQFGHLKFVRCLSKRNYCFISPYFCSDSSLHSLSLSLSLNIHILPSCLVPFYQEPLATMNFHGNCFRETREVLALPLGYQVAPIASVLWITVSLDFRVAPSGHTVGPDRER